MNMLEIARRFAALGEKAEAVKAYKLALGEVDGLEPADELECALHILQLGSGDDYKISYTCFKNLYNQGFAPDDCLAVMDAAFYQPNLKKLQKRYEKNCRLLAKYPYIFRQDFPAFEDLPVIFFPYDDNQYTPYFVAERQFGEFFAPKNQVISRNFFKDLEQPILAVDVFSQYELEYLHDNVRKSEWVARENHIYLHYTSWPVFCAYLQCLDLLPILQDEKIVFLFEIEIGQYPIDFKQRFGIDYSQYEVKPIGIREITRLIWHTQLSNHNGGDFFNEVFDSHPNLLAFPSVMFDSVEEGMAYYEKTLRESADLQEAQSHLRGQKESVVAKLWKLRKRTSKDIFVAMCLSEKDSFATPLDESARILPAIFFQPHFHVINYTLRAYEQNWAQLYSDEYDKIHNSAIFKGFKYIKTFTPMRRFTTSHGAGVRFSLKDHEINKDRAVMDMVLNRVLNRSFMIDWQDRLFKDCRLVRFEDGKLNPRATFTALASFLDLPYTESLTCCSEYGKIDPESYEGNDIGFSTAAVYRTYDDYTNDAERAFIEYFLRDAYEYYGYDFHYYDGQPVDEERVNEWLAGFRTIDYYMRITMVENLTQEAEELLQEKQQKTGFPKEITPKMKEDLTEQLLDKYMRGARDERLDNTKILLRSLSFVNRNGQPLHMMPKLELDPALLEQPLYH